MTKNPHFWIPIALPILLLWTGCSGTHAVRERAEVAAEINSKKAEAMSLIESGDYAAAAALLEPLTGERVRDSQVHAMLAKARWKMGAYSQAVSSYEDALRLDYGNSEIHLEFGQMLMEMNKIGRALTELELAVKFDHRAALPHYNYGLALHRAGRSDAALSQWQLAYDSEPTNPDYVAALGIGYTGRDDRRALEYFNRAEELGADDADFHNNFGLLLMRMQHLDRARDEFLRATSREPERDAFAYNLAVIYMKTADYAAAIPILERLFSSSPERRSYRVYLARAYMEDGQFDEAIELLEPWVTEDKGPDPARGRSEEPGRDEAYGILAMSYRGIGRGEEAEALMSEALKIAPENVIHLINYGVILAENGRIGEARAQWEKVLRLQPDNTVAKQNLSATER